MRIAIVEDDEKASALLKAHFARLKAEKGVECDLTVFNDGISFLDGYNQTYDAVLMDIEMPYMNGYEAAKKLREKDSSVTLVFITNLKQYALKGYEVEALDFLVKPVSYAAFSTLMGRIAAKARSKRDDSVCISTGKGAIRLSVYQIRYVEVMRHYIIYHTAIGDFELYGRLVNEEERLKKFGCFAYCARCYLVNLNYVKKIEGHDCYIGDEVICVSRSKKATFKKALMEFVGGTPIS